MHVALLSFDSNTKNRTWKKYQFLGSHGSDYSILRRVSHTQNALNRITTVMPQTNAHLRIQIVINNLGHECADAPALLLLPVTVIIIVTRLQSSAGSIYRRFCGRRSCLM